MQQLPPPVAHQSNLGDLHRLGLFNLSPAQQQQLLSQPPQSELLPPVPLPQAFMTSPFGMPLLGTAIQKPTTTAAAAAAITPAMNVPGAAIAAAVGDNNSLSQGLGCLGLTGLELSPQKSSSPMGPGLSLIHI